MVVHAGRDLEYAALANSTYDLSLAYKAQRDAAGGGSPRPRTRSSFDRFATAAEMAEAYDRADGPPVEYAFSVLDSVSSGGTQWSIVYDARTGAILYRTRANPAVRRIALSMFDFSCPSPMLFVDIEKSPSGRSDFEVYGYEANLKLIDAVWGSVAFLQSIPRETRIAWARYPESVRCVGGE
jgi:hypothetical protein